MRDYDCSDYKKQMTDRLQRDRCTRASNKECYAKDGRPQMWKIGASAKRSGIP